MLTMTFRDHTHDECRPQAPHGSHLQSRVLCGCSLVDWAWDVGVEGVGSIPRHLCYGLTPPGRAQSSFTLGSSLGHAGRNLPGP